PAAGRKNPMEPWRCSYGMIFLFTHFIATPPGLHRILPACGRQACLGLAKWWEINPWAFPNIGH
ncbi:MAG: hypothetical protein RIF39_00895, partial [Cyclobacteriaceae bacterium]